MDWHILKVFGWILTACVSFASCKTQDSVPPIITLLGEDTIAVALYGTYAEQGARAIDEIDGPLEVSITGTVNSNSSGWYTLIYSATDNSGNVAMADRHIMVDAGLFVAGIYSGTDVCIGITSAVYIDTISVPVNEHNKIMFGRFAAYVNASVYATISGTTIQLPQQDVYCGFPSKLRTFSGFGSFTDSSVMINYTKVTNDTVITGVNTYIRQ
jgi:hypothetical protein